MIVGIDIGGTTTKIVGLGRDGTIAYATVKASDPVASAAGAIGKFLAVAGKKMSDIDRLAVTGVGSTFIDKDILGIKVEHVEEFQAVGLGGLELSGAKRALVVSVGTGTAIVHAEGRLARHVGGSGVGGGTILGLGKALAGISDFDNFALAASKGCVENVDLTISDISSGAVGTLPPNATASNFGKMADRPSPEDYAAGIVNMVFQTVGMLAILAARAEGDTAIVIVGNTMQIPMAREILGALYPVYGVKFIVPELAQYATAMGAALFLKD
ncbi:MAG: BadF/BadG/BcrA/BcrD ATPase family protein [Rectinemataceae bacterium]